MAQVILRGRAAGEFLMLVHTSVGYLERRSSKSIYFTVVIGPFMRTRSAIWRSKRLCYHFLTPVVKFGELVHWAVEVNSGPVSSGKARSHPHYIEKYSRTLLGVQYAEEGCN